MANKKLIPVKDNGGLARDPRSGAVLSTDTKAYELHKKKKLLKRQEKEKIEQLEQRMDDINTKMEGIENMLVTILEKLEEERQ